MRPQVASLLRTARTDTEYLVPKLRVSISSGVAPLGVVVDGVQTAWKGGNSFHDLLYFFDFGDTDANVFTYGSNPGESKNKHAGGPVACYVYENPGTYTIKMWVYDGTRVWGPVITNVTATNPDTVYAGTLTVCCSTSGNFTGAPSGATQVTSSDFNTIFTTHAATSGKRILLRAGEVFTRSVSTAASANRSDMYFGAFGAGVKPILRCGANNTVMFQGLANGGNPANAPNRWRVVGLRIESGGFTGCTSLIMSQQEIALRMAMNPSAYFGDFTYHDLEIDGMLTGTTSILRNTVASKWVVTNVQNSVAASGGLPFYATNYYQCGLLDCSFDNGGGGEHSLRSNGGFLMSVRGITLKRPASLKHHLAHRGDPGYETRWSVYSNVNIDSTGDVGSSYHIQVGLTNTTVIERVSDVIFEKTMVFASPVLSPVVVEADDVQFRSSIVVAANTTAASNCIATLRTSTAGMEYASGLRVRNCSFYYAGTQGMDSVNLVANTFAHEVVNCVAYAPNATRNGSNGGSAPNFVTDASANLRASGNSSDSQVKSTSPLWAAPGSTLASFELGVGSPYIDAGSVALVPHDARGKVRNVAGASDTGAVNSAAKATDIWTLIPV